MSRLVAIVLALLVTTTVAHAYPHFQGPLGASTCGQCHLSPAGGGPLSAYGRDEMADTLSRGGDGRFLHGAIELPDWLALGGDVRVAALANEVGADDGVELAAFPMQLDLTAAVARGAWSAVAIVGARGTVRGGSPTSPDNPASEVSGPTLGSYVISREHYLMWKPIDAGAYARLGRFAAPYGLRLADHTTYVRRYLGYNLMEETYGASAGYFGSTWEAHATLFASDPLQGSPRREVGGAVMAEYQGENVIVGGSARVGVASAETRAQAGLHAKAWLVPSKLVLQGEVDGVRQIFDGGGDRWQLAGYLGPVWIPTRGIYTGVGYQAFAEDLAVRGVLRQSIDAWVSYLPRAHFEVMASTRAQRIGPDEHAYLAMLQVHYTL